MKHFTEEEIDAFINDPNRSHPKDWFFAYDFWINRTKDGLQPDVNNPHYAGLNRCWGWNGRVLGGYGVIQKFDKTKGAHRVSYEIHYGPIPDGMIIMHKCDNKICTNPEHLEAGTSRQNIKSAHERGLVRAGKAKSLSPSANELPYLVIGSVINSLEKHLNGIMRGEEQERLIQMWRFQDELRLLLKDCFAVAHPDRKFLRPKQAKTRIENIDLSQMDMLEQWLYEIDDESRN